MIVRVMRREVEVNEEVMRELWSSELRNDEVAERLELTRGQMWTLSKRLNLPQRPDHLRAWGDQTGRTKDDPTIEEIEARAEAIRETWSDATRASRTVGGKCRAVNIPSYHCSANSAGRRISFASTVSEF